MARISSDQLLLSQAVHQLVFPEATLHCFPRSRAPPFSRKLRSPVFPEATFRNTKLKLGLRQSRLSGTLT